MTLQLSNEGRAALIDLFPHEEWCPKAAWVKADPGMQGFYNREPCTQDCLKERTIKADALIRSGLLDVVMDNTLDDLEFMPDEDDWAHATASADPAEVVAEEEPPSQ
jgi:hypothetical protein